MKQRGPGRALMMAGSLARLVYAVGLLVAPDAMSRARLAPSTPDNPYARMTTRAFGAVHINIAVLTLRAAMREDDPSSVLRLNLGCDLGDLVATGVEGRTGTLPPLALAGSSLVQLSGMAVWWNALRRLQGPTQRAKIAA